MTLSPRLLALGSAVVAGTIWGSWAYFVNSDSSQAYVSAITQFVSSMIVTMLMSVIVLKTQSQFKNSIARVLCPALISSSIAIAILLVSHIMVRTENLILTITGPALVGSIYCLFYSYKISK